MALGSNSLGLLFKIGVDAKDAEAVFRELMATNKEFAKGVEEGMQAELRASLGAAQGLEKVTSSARETVTHVTALNNAFKNIVQGNFGSAISGIGRALASGNPLMIAFVAAVVALGVAILSAKKLIDGLVEAAHDVGTDSKEDFEKLRGELERVNFQLTLADHALSQALNQSFKDLSSQVTALFVDVLRPAGPALIGLLNQVIKLLQDAQPLVKSFADTLTFAIISLTALIKTAREFKAVDIPIPGASAAANAIQFAAALRTNLDIVKKEYEALVKSLAGQTGTFKPIKDASDAADRDRAARIDLLEANSRREQQIYEASALSAKLAYMGGAITSAEATAIEIQTRQKLQKVLEDNAREISALNKKQDESATEKAAREQTLANDRIDLQRRLIAEAQKFQEGLNNADAQQRKNDEDRLKRLDKILEGEKLLNEIIKERARAAQEVPGGGAAGTPGRDLPPIPGVISITDAIKNLPKPDLTIWEEWGKAATGAIGQVADSFGGLQGIMAGGLQKVASALEQGIEGWILYGKFSGKALKQAAAEAIAGMVAQSIVATIFETAAAFASLAWGDYAGFIKHLHAAEVYGTVAAVGAVVGGAIGAAGGILGGSAASGASAGGGFGGASSEPPGTVTINQGGGATLGIQLLGVMSDIRNTLTTASPQDVVAIGAERNPVAIGQANNEASRRDGSISREFLQISGLRTA